MAEKTRPISVGLFRCGRSQWTLDGRLRGMTDLPLSAEGRAALLQDLEELAEMTATVIHHPSDEAATETAGVLAERIGGRRRPVDDLADPDLGLLEGMSADQFADRYRTRYKRWQNDPLALSPPEGEGLAVARRRIFQAVARLLRKTRQGGTVLVLHDYALGMLSCWLQDRPASELWKVLDERPLFEHFELTAGQLDRLESVAEAAEVVPIPEETAA